MGWGFSRTVGGLPTFLAGFLFWQALSACGQKDSSSETSGLDPRKRKIVVFRKSFDYSVDSTVAKIGLDPRETIRYRSLFHGFSARLTEAQELSLKGQSGIAAIVEDRGIDIPAKASGGVSLLQSTDTEVIPKGLSRVLEGSLEPNRRIEIDATVAVIDSGVQKDHPDLNVLRAVSVGVPHDPLDQCGHGTHVAGIIGAKSNELGSVGVAPGAKIISISMVDEPGCKGTVAATIQGLEYVYDHRAEIDVVNMSLGAPDLPVGSCDAPDNPYRQAICRLRDAGIPVVVAAGNQGQDVDALHFVPAIFPEVISVSAISDFDGQPGRKAGDKDDVFASYSNFGASITIAAPGTGIFSTHINSGFGLKTGTSMAAPHVAGALALLVANTREIKGLYSKNLANYADYLRMILVNESIKPGSWEYFTGDRDQNAEPLLRIRREWLPRSPESRLSRLHFVASGPSDGSTINASLLRGVTLWMTKRVTKGPYFDRVNFVSSSGTVPGTAWIDSSGFTVVVTPNTPLMADQDYKMIVPTGFVRDLSGKERSLRKVLNFRVVP